MRSLSELSAAFVLDRFCYEAPVYATYVRELIQLDPTESESEEYFELLESMLEMLRYSADPQLTEDDRNLISDRACAAWDPNLPDHRRATIMVIAGAIMPHDPTRAWLQKKARDAPPDVAAYMLETAHHNYENPAV